MALLGFSAPRAISAAPVRGAAEAKASEFKEGTVALARARALRRARTEALEAALTQLEGPVDPESRRAVLRSGQGWTGAYRVLAESVTGTAGEEVVRLEIEADIDLMRLAKRVAPRSGALGAPRYRLAKVESPAGVDGCGEHVDALVRAELEGAGVVGRAAKTAVSLTVSCRDLGPVPHTYVSVAQVEVGASVGSTRLRAQREVGMGADPEAARAVALQRALEAVAEGLAPGADARVNVQVRSPLPAARIRRLERALADSVIGVSSVRVWGVELDGSVVLQVQGNVDARTLAQRLEALSLPDFSVTMAQVQGPDAITITLQ